MADSVADWLSDTDGVGECISISLVIGREGSATTVLVGSSSTALVSVGSERPKYLTFARTDDVFFNFNNCSSLKGDLLSIICRGSVSYRDRMS